MSKHTLSVLVENKPGVLARVAALFSRRGFNIDSLAVGPTEHPEVSRMTILVNVAESPLEQVTKQLNKLVEVIKIVELDHSQSVNRELLLVKVKADSATRGQVLEIVQLFRAKVVDVATDAITIQIVGNPDKLADFLRMVEPYGVRELVQSGMVAIGRGSRSISERTLKPVRRAGPAGRRLTHRSSTRSTNEKEGPPWLRCSTTTTPTCRWCRGATWRSWATGARGTPTRCRCATAASTSASGSPRARRAGRRPRPRGCTVLTPAEACEEADLIMILAPDHVQRTLYKEAVEPNLVEGDALFFGHGFNIRFGYITPPEGVDVCMVAPKGPGHLVRREFSEGRGVPVLVAVEEDASGKAWELALSYAKGIGGLRAGGIRPRSPRSARPTCSASRPSSAAAPRSWSCTASRP